MPTLRDYVTETEQWADTPREGDDLDIEIAPDELAEGVVIESDGEYIVLAVTLILLRNSPKALLNSSALE